MKQKLVDFLNVFSDLQKALVMLLLIAIGVIFRVENLIASNDFTDLLKNTVVAFFAAHCSQHIVASVKSYYSNQNGPSDDTPKSNPPTVTKYDNP